MPVEIFEMVIRANICEKKQKEKEKKKKEYKTCDDLRKRLEEERMGKIQ